MPKLISPSIKYKQSFIQAQTDRHNLGEKIRGFDKRLISMQGNFDNYISWLKKDFPAYINIINQKNTPNPISSIPQQDFWLVDSSSFLGRSTLRFTLNDRLKKVGGHIGIYINPQFRSLGYGTLLLQKTVQVSKNKQISPLLLTVSKFNHPSISIIKKSGGQHIRTKKNLLYFQID